MLPSSFVIFFNTDFLKIILIQQSSYPKPKGKLQENSINICTDHQTSSASETDWNRQILTFSGEKK